MLFATTTRVNEDHRCLGTGYGAPIKLCNILLQIATIDLNFLPRGIFNTSAGGKFQFSSPYLRTPTDCFLPPKEGPF